MRMTTFLSVALVASMLFVAPASAAEIPMDPDEIAPEGEIEECGTILEATNPFSDVEWDEYKACKEQEMEHNIRADIAGNVAFLIDTKEGIESWFADKQEAAPIV